MTVKPAAPSSDDIVSAAADRLRRRRRRRGDLHATSGSATAPRSAARPAARSTSPSRATATPATPLAVDVTALDGNGGTSPAVRGSQTVGAAAPRTPVASYGFEEAAGTAIVDESGGNDGTLDGATRSNAGRFGRALSLRRRRRHRDRARRAAARPRRTGMTLEAWVRPRGRHQLAHACIFKESGGGLAYALYANSDTDVPSVEHRLGRRAPRGTDRPRPGQVDPPGGHVRRHDAAAVRQRRPGRRRRRPAGRAAAAATAR